MTHYSHVRMAAKREAVGKLSSGLMDRPVAEKKDEVDPARKVN
ncbi:MAG: hypothetical protein O2968_23455 [Acidobacteria bacterium]|nr:hypothetical protein [Acidobacteriota bacterium]